ncbi:ABC transporter permease [Phocaeicola sp.]
MIKHLLTVIFRNLAKQKGRSIISVLCITAGLLCFSICHYYNTVLSRGNQSLATYECMAVVRQAGSTHSYYNYLWKPEQLGKDEIKAIASFYNNTQLIVTASGALYQVSATFCNHDYFTVFPPKLLEGSLKEFDKRPEIIVVTRKFIKEYADAGTSIGSTITIDKESYTIGAIIDLYPSGMNNYIDNYDLFIPKKATFGDTVLLLSQPSDIDILNKRISALEAQNEIKSQLYLQSQMPNNKGMEVWISIIGLIILMIALTNYFSFSIGCFANRSRELTLRQCLGGKSKDLFWLLFGEQFITLFLSCILTLALTESLLPLFFDSLSYETRRELKIEIPVLLQSEIKYFGIILCISFFLCYASVTRIIYLARQKGLSGRQRKGKHALRNISLTLQFFFSLLFLIGIMGVHFQMKGYSNSTTPLLNDKEKQDLIIIPTRSYDDRIVKELPDICDYFRSRSWCKSLSLLAVDRMSIDDKNIIVNSVTETFLDQMKVEKQHKQGEAFCYITPETDAEMRRDSSFYSLNYSGHEYPITGTCRVYPEPRYRTSYLAMVSLEENNWASKIILQLTPGANRKQATQDIAQKLNAYYPANSPYEITTLYDEQVGMLDILKNLFVVCTIISLLITILGIFHSIQIDTERRQKEVAIRKVNGAQTTDIYWLFGKSYILLYMIAIALAVPLCLFLMIMADRMIKFDYSHPLLWGVPLFIAATVIALTISWRIYQIARINPSEIIKNE